MVQLSNIKRHKQNIFPIGEVSTTDILYLIGKLSIYECIVQTRDGKIFKQMFYWSYQNKEFFGDTLEFTNLKKTYYLRIYMSDIKKITIDYMRRKDKIWGLDKIKKKRK